MSVNKYLRATVYIIAVKKKKKEIFQSLCLLWMFNLLYQILFGMLDYSRSNKTFLTASLPTCNFYTYLKNMKKRKNVVKKMFYKIRIYFPINIIALQMTKCYKIQPFYSFQIWPVPRCNFSWYFSLFLLQYI